MRTLKFGGQLSVGDFIAVSNGNCISFGWYVGDGRGGTLQYYWMKGPGQIYEDYLNWKKDPSSVKHSWYVKMFEKHGFSMKLFWKSYINAVHDSRVIKITRPEDIFTNQEDREDYEKSKEALIKLNFIRK